MSATTRFTRPTDVGSEVLFPKPQILRITGVDVSTPYLSGLFDWGETNKAIDVFGVDDLQEKYINGGETYLTAWLMYQWYRLPKIVINGIRHYTDPTDRTTITAVRADLDLEDIQGVPAVILNAEAKYYGKAGNDIQIKAGPTAKIQNRETTSAVTNGDLEIELDDVTSIEPGEILFLDDSVNSTYVKVDRVDVINSKVLLTAAVAGLGAPLTVPAAVESLNSYIEIYFRGQLWRRYDNLSFEKENLIDYVENAIARGFDRYVNFTVNEANLSATLSERVLADTGSTLVDLTGGDNGTALVADDYIGNRVEKTGIYTLENYGEGKLPVVICLPEAAELTALVDVAKVQRAAINYCDEKNIHFFQGDIPFGMNPDDLKTYLNVTARINSEFSAYTYPNFIMIRPDEESVPAKFHTSGFVVGRYSFTDRSFGKGAWQSSAGEIFGELFGIIELEKVLWKGELVTPTEDVDVNQDLRAQKVNPVRFSTAINNFIIDGAFTRALGRRVTYPHINQIRTIQYVGASVDFSLTQIRFANHDERLEDRVKTLVLQFIDEQSPEMLAGASPQERRIVQCGPENNPRDKNDPSIILNPEDLNVDIYLNVQTPTLRTHYRVQKRIASQLV